VPSWQRVYLAVCAGVSAYSLAYMGVDYGHVPRLYHHPLVGEWRWEVRAQDPIAAGYVGLWSWACVLGIVVAALTYGFTRWRRHPASSRTLALGSAWTLTLVLITAAYYTWNNFP
jgi:hypothetical protein